MKKGYKCNSSVTRAVGYRYMSPGEAIPGFWVSGRGVEHDKQGLAGDLQSEHFRGIGRLPEEVT